MLHLFLKGGPVMWPLLVTSLVSLSTIFERIIASYREKRRRRPADVRVILRELREDNIPAALEAGTLSSDFVARCLACGLQCYATDFGVAYQHQAARELRRLSRGLPILDTVITLAPLLGLLGTVTGMIHAFGLMGASELEAPTAITGGIAEALIATAFGLGIAITSLIPFNWLNAKVERAQHELQDLGTQAEMQLTRALQKPALRRPSDDRQPSALSHS